MMAALRGEDFCIRVNNGPDGPATSILVYPEQRTARDRLDWSVQCQKRQPPGGLFLLLHRRRDVRFLGGLSHPRKHLVVVELVHGGQLDAAGGLAHSERCHWGFRL